MCEREREGERETVCLRENEREREREKEGEGVIRGKESARESERERECACPRKVLHVQPQSPSKVNLVPELNSCAGDGRREEAYRQVQDPRGRAQAEAPGTALPHPPQSTPTTRSVFFLFSLLWYVPESL
eukprot:3081020-Rhodomonas_salina.1